MEIREENIKPYFIKLKTHGNYTVLEDKFKKNEKGEDIITEHGYFSSVESALNKIAKLLVEVDRIYTVKEYIKELKEVKIKIEQ